MSVYHEVRLPHDAARDVLWRTLWRYYFHQFIGPDDCVLDIGCGHGAFINSVVARKRLGLDSVPVSRGDFWLTSGWVSREVVRAIKVR
jgi:hypothetical protein